MGSDGPGFKSQFYHTVVQSQVHYKFPVYLVNNTHAYQNKVTAQRERIYGISLAFDFLKRKNNPGSARVDKSANCQTTVLFFFGLTRYHPRNRHNDKLCVST